MTQRPRCVLFATDLHGRRSAYDELMDLACERDAGAVLFGGDLLPHPDPDDLVGVQTAFVDEALTPWLGELAERRPGTPVFAVPGNDDWGHAFDRLCARAPDNFKSIHRTTARWSDWTLAGYGCVPITPFFMADFDRRDSDGWQPQIPPGLTLVTNSNGEVETPDGYFETVATIEAEFSPVAAGAVGERALWITHSPPHATALDRLGDGTAVGSAAVRTLIERHRPAVTLHGHIHESPRVSGRIADRVGHTLSVNPGPSLAGLRAVEIDLDDPHAEPRTFGSGFDEECPHGTEMPPDERRPEQTAQDAPQRASGRGGRRQRAETEPGEHS